MSSSAGTVPICWFVERSAIRIPPGEYKYVLGSSGLIHHHTWQYSGLMAAAETCMTKGHACLNHCINTFKGGDTSLVSCAVLVQETIAACNALAQLSASAAHTKAFANACAGVCGDCEGMPQTRLQAPELCGLCRGLRRLGAGSQEGCLSLSCAQAQRPSEAVGLRHGNLS